MMTVEKTATFTVRDLKAIVVECPERKTQIIIPLGGDVKVDESLYCPRCKQDGEQIIWTAAADSRDKRLVAALIGASGRTRSAVRMIAGIED